MTNISLLLIIITEKGMENEFKNSSGYLMQNYGFNCDPYYSFASGDCVQLRCDSLYSFNKRKKFETKFELTITS